MPDNDFSEQAILNRSYNDTLKGLRMIAAQSLPINATAVTGTSGNVANASAVAALPAVGGRLNHITGFQLTASGATAGLVVAATVTGLIDGTQTYTFVFPAGVLVAATPLLVVFPTPIPASGLTTAITLTLPAGGAGNTNASANIQGFKI